MTDILGGVLFGAIGGLGWGMMGAVNNYLSDSKTKEEFDGKKFLRPVVLGVVVGGYLGATAMDFSYDLANATVESAAFTPFVAIVDKAVAVIWKFIGKAKAKFE